eukprot:133377_1
MPTYHLLWKIPITIYSYVCERIRLSSFPFSGLVTFKNLSIRGWMTPFTIEYSLNKTEKGDTEDTFNRVECLNVNLFHDLWKGFEFEFLHIQNDNPSTALYLFRLYLFRLWWLAIASTEWNNLFHTDFNR